MKAGAPASASAAIAENFSVSFEEFVIWLIKYRKFSANEHWKPQEWMEFFSLDFFFHFFIQKTRLRTASHANIPSSGMLKR